MRVSVRTTEEADALIERASDWWRENRPAAPWLFDDELAAAFGLLSDAPTVGRRLRRHGIPNLRRILLPGACYHVYYAYIAERQEVIVLAVWSAVRGRGPKLSPP